MQANNEHHIETKVGLFALIGFLVAGGMIVQFGRFGESGGGSYQIDVSFPDASGLYRGAEVLMSGARIGRVAEDPALLPDKEGVLVKLRIIRGVDIPSGAKFRIGSSGLLGDRYVQIVRDPETARKGGAIKPGSTVSGTREAGLDDFTRNSEEILVEAKSLLASIQKSTEKIETKLLTDENLQNVQKAVAGAGATAERLSKSSERLEAILDDAGKAVQSVREASAGLSDFVRDARSGGGLLQALMSDRHLAENFQSLVSSLRARGLIFYRDRAREEPEPRRRPRE